MRVQACERERECVCVCVCIDVCDCILCLVYIMQLFAEFQLLSGENCTERVRSNWTRCAAVLLSKEREAVASQEEQLKALQLVDKKFDSSGQGATCPAAFGIYQVHTLLLFCTCTHFTLINSHLAAFMLVGLCK